MWPLMSEFLVLGSVGLIVGIQYWKQQEFHFSASIDSDIG